MGIWVGRYAIVRGDVHEHGPWLAEQRRTQDDEQVRLIVLTEPVDERSAEFCEEVAAAVADLFAQEELSLTGGLLRAIRRAHSNLAEWNHRSLREHRVAVGVTCVALRAGEATIAQVGPGLVYLSRPDGVRRITTEGEPAANPLGGEDDVTPQFLATSTADTEILLLSSSAETAAGPPAIGQALAAGANRALADLFLRTRNVDDVHAALIADLPLPDDPLEAGGPLDLELPKVATPSTDVYAPRSEPEPPPATVAGSPTIPAAAERTARPELPGPARSLRGRLPALRQARVAGSAPGPPWRLLSAGLIGAVALVIAVIAIVPPLFGEDGRTKLEAKLSNASQLLADATLSNDVDQQRVGLQAALEELEQARSIDDGDQRITSLQAIVQQRLADLNHVHELGELRTVLRFEGVLTAPLTPAGLTVGGGWLWLLDACRGRVFAVDPGGILDPVEAYRAGTSCGGADAADPLDIAWDDVGRQLLLLDAERTLFSLTAGATPALLPLRDASALATIDGVAAYDGNLYLLDAGGGEVWRYLPAGDGFDSERSGVLGAIPIADTRALLVDGDVFLLDAAGLRRFAGGREGVAQLQGIDTPLNSPTGLAEDLDRGLIYIADRGGRRIVVGDRDGAFVRQYTHPDFTDLRGIALSARGGTVYVLTGSAILAFDPPLDTPAASAR